MERRERSIIVALFALAACGSSAKEIRTAKHSVYDADFATVYSAALDATRALYPNIDDHAGAGRIKTAWHQVQLASQTDDMVGQSVPANGYNGMAAAPTSTSMPGASTPTQLALKKFFIRFDVTVMGGRPWKIKVVGHAAEWDTGDAMPVELHGAARPSWLGPRTDALQVAIYKKISKYAVPMKDEEPANPEDELPKTDPKVFKDVPPGAAQRLAQVKDALARRDYDALAQGVADDVVWSLGGGTGGDAAMAMWKADPTAFQAMSQAIAAGCAAAGQKVTCPAGPPVAGKFQLVLEPRGPAWKITSFVQAE
jgi:hypothetical protein